LRVTGPEDDWLVAAALELPPLAELLDDELLLPHAAIAVAATTATTTPRPRAATRLNLQFIGADLSPR
jgi:hypothetical protein